MPEETNGHIELSVGERLSLLTVLPKEGNIATLRIVRDLQHSLSLSEEEHTEGKVAVADNPNGPGLVFSMDPAFKATHLKRVELGDVAKKLIADELQALSHTKKLTMDCLPLYERFVEGGLVASQ